MNARHRDHLMRIFRAALAAVDPAAAVRRFVRLDGEQLVAGSGCSERAICRTADCRSIWLVGCGKAGAPMAAAVAQLLGERISGGVVVVKNGHRGACDSRRVRVLEACHPVPDAHGLAGAREVLSVLHGAGPDDLVIAVVSGGGSALWPLPAEGITLEAKQETTSLLLGCGADIHEVNCVRKHLSGIKGGWAARHALPATVLMLAMSDVVGDDLDVIASGPFSSDRSTFAQAIAVVDKYGLRTGLPQSVRVRLESGSRGEVTETPKPGDRCFCRVSQFVCASNAMALAGASVAARELGYEPVTVASNLSGDVGTASRVLVAEIKRVVSSLPGGQRVCILAGGETTVSLGKSVGKGGRNMEFALMAAPQLVGMENEVTMLCCGSDGTDGPTDAAGGFADRTTVRRAGAVGLDVADALARHDSYPLLGAIGDIIITGPTMTNVMDIDIVLIG
jgi:glycerate 2-kinase